MLVRSIWDWQCSTFWEYYTTFKWVRYVCYWKGMCDTLACCLHYCVMHANCTYLKAFNFFQCSQYQVPLCHCCYVIFLSVTSSLHVVCFSVTAGQRPMSPSTWTSLSRPNTIQPLKVTFRFCNVAHEVSQNPTYFTNC